VSIGLNALTFVVSAFAISAIRAGEKFAAPERAEAVEMPSVLAEIRTGARALRGAPTAIRLIAADVLCSAVYGILTVTLVLVSRRVGAGDGGYGLLLGGFGVGGVIGASVTGRIGGPARWRRTLTVAMVLVGVPLAGLGVVPTLAGALALAMLGGGGMIVGEVLCETALPRMLDDEVLARAYGVVFPISVGGIVVGSLVAGPLVALLGVAGALAAVGAAVLLAGALLLCRPLVLVAAARPALSSAG
jgi:predicted MFS family arabinose efflux permease